MELDRWAVCSGKQGVFWGWHEERRGLTGGIGALLATDARAQRLASEIALSEMHLEVAKASRQASQAEMSLQVTAT